MHQPELDALEVLLDHRFHNRHWLELALTHSTHRQESNPASTADNERLEFLGDAVVGLVVSQFLAERFPDWTAGQLSQAKARLVSAESLSEAARRLNLGVYLRLGRGEEKTGGREKQTLLADAFEALVAALFFDGGLPTAHRFVESALLAASLRNGADAPEFRDHKSSLQEYLQARGRAPADYRVVGESGPDHNKVFVVQVAVEGQALASGEGASKKKAEQQAAATALQQLREMESSG